jgi:hypothetical protein
MNARDLKNFLKDIPDDTRIVVENTDHSYRYAHASYQNVVVENVHMRYKNIREYYETQDKNLSPEDGMIVKAVIIT